MCMPWYKYVNNNCCHWQLVTGHHLSGVSGDFSKLVVTCFPLQFNAKSSIGAALLFQCYCSTRHMIWRINVDNYIGNVQRWWPLMIFCSVTAFACNANNGLYNNGRYLGNHASQIESWYRTLSGSHDRSFRNRHEKLPEAPPSGEITMTSYPACNETSSSRKPCILDKSR